MPILLPPQGGHPETISGGPPHIPWAVWALPMDPAVMWWTSCLPMTLLGRAFPRDQGIFQKLCPSLRDSQPGSQLMTMTMKQAQSGYEVAWYQGS
jgi:hypothetical protein